MAIIYKNVTARPFSLSFALVYEKSKRGQCLRSKVRLRSYYNTTRVRILYEFIEFYRKKMQFRALSFVKYNFYCYLCYILLKKNCQVVYIKRI